MLLYVIFVELIELKSCILFMGNDPPHFSGTSVVHSCAVTCQITREDVAIIDICMVVSIRLLCFHYMAAGRQSDSTPDTKYVRLCSRFRCGSYGAGSPTAVVCSRELVSCGNRGNLCCS